MGDFQIGYGRDEIEPGIAVLVRAVLDAGFTTFASCEGHDDREGFTYGSVAFFADENAARPVHAALIGMRERLGCSWVLRAGFVHRTEVGGWALGWTLENCGIKANVSTEQFALQTLEESREKDIPILVNLFASLKR